jgi:hypothetical protein
MKFHKPEFQINIEAVEPLAFLSHRYEQLSVKPDNVLSISGRLACFPIRNKEEARYVFLLLLLLLLLLFLLTANGFLPSGSGTTIRHNMQIYISHRVTTSSNNTAHKATQAIKDALHAMNTMQKK